MDNNFSLFNSNVTEKVSTVSPDNTDIYFSGSCQLPVSMFDCKVVVEDVFSNREAEKLNTLNIRRGNFHSADSRAHEDLAFLNNMERKDPILWPLMSDEKSWGKLENDVLQVIVPSTFDISGTVALLQDTIYNKA